MYIPLEIFTREYFPKLALTLFAAERNYEVIFGHKWFVNAIALDVAGEGDVYLEKGQFLGSATRHLQELRTRSVILIGYDEEAGLNFSDYPKYAREYLRPEGIDFFDYWLTWGPRDFNFLRNSYGMSSAKLGDFGTPRSAYWVEPANLLFQSRADVGVKSKPKKFILFCTNFVWQSSASFNGLSELFEGVPFSLKEKLIATYHEPIHNDFEADSFIRFRSAIQVLLKEFDLDIVVRPHPAEVQNGPSAKLREYFGGRVFLDRSSSISSLIRRSVAVFHMGSTVAFESILARKIAISLSNFERPPNSLQEQDNSNLVSFLPKDAQEAVGIVRFALDGRFETNAAYVHELIWQSDFPYFYNRFFDEIKCLPITKGVRKDILAGISTNPFRIFLLRHIGKYKESKNAIDSVKRPNIGLQKLKKDIEVLSTCLGIPGNWKLEQIERSTFRIQNIA